jgi:hypothetical protein
MRFAGLSLMPMYYTRLGVRHTTRSIQAPSHYVDLALSRTCILISHVRRRKVVPTSVERRAVDTTGELVVAWAVHLLVYTSC